LRLPFSNGSTVQAKLRRKDDVVVHEPGQDREPTYARGRAADSCEPCILRPTLRKTIRDRHHRVRRSLQKKAAKGTSSTRRRCRPIVKRLSGQERRFQAAENHAISKRIVEDAIEDACRSKT
jgi:hypothetical protein